MLLSRSEPVQLAASAALHDLYSFHRPNKVAYLHQLKQQLLAGNCDVGAKLLHTPSLPRLLVTQALRTMSFSLWTACHQLHSTARLWESSHTTKRQFDVDARPHTPLRSGARRPACQQH